MSRVIKWTLFVAAVLIVVVLSVSPSTQVPSVPGGDKLAHLTAYAGLALLARGVLTWRRAALVLLALGTALEFAQLLIPSRSTEWMDLAANGTGILVGFVVVAVRAGVLGQGTFFE